MKPLIVPHLWLNVVLSGNPDVAPSHSSRDFEVVRINGDNFGNDSGRPHRSYQWIRTRLFGMTVFGVADHLFEPASEGSTASVFGEDLMAMV